MAPEQVRGAGRSPRRLSSRRSASPRGALRLELMIETTQSILDATGAVAAAPPGRRRRRAAASPRTSAPTTTPRCCDITAAHQHMAHPACDFAKHMMQVALAGTRRLALRRRHQRHAGGAPSRRAGRPAARRRAARGQPRGDLHAPGGCTTAHVRHSLEQRLLPGLGPPPGAAAHAATPRSTPSSSRASTRRRERLRNFVDKAAQATLVGDVFDDAATGQGLLNYFLRAVDCGAIDEAEAWRAAG